MLDYLLAPQNITFALAGGLMGLMGVLQIVSFVIGFTPLSGLDDWLGSSLDVDMGAAPTFGEAFLSLLGVGKVPVVFSFLFFLFSYASLGYGLQWVWASAGGELWPAWLVSVVVFLATLPVLRVGNSVLAKVVPLDETTAISEATFVGKLATVTIGTVTSQRSAEARLEDDYGRTHYVQVVADADEDTFRAGEEVVIVGKRGSAFTIVRGPTAMLLEE